jgi:hypothetical protein
MWCSFLWMDDCGSPGFETANTQVMSRLEPRFGPWYPTTETPMYRILQNRLA